MAEGPEPRGRPGLRHDRAAAPELLFRLGEDHPRDRVQATEDLVAWGNDAALAVPGIAQRLEDPNGHVRAAAARALGQLSTAAVWGRTPGELAAAAVPALAKRLADADPLIRKGVSKPLEDLRATGVIGELTVALAPVLPDLEAQLRDEEWLQRESAAKMCAGLGPVAAPLMPQLLLCCADSSHQVRKAAKATLQELCSCPDLEDLQCFCAPVALELQARLEHEDWRVRCAAAWALGMAGGAVATGARRLAEILTERRDREDHLLAIEALWLMGPSVAPALPEVITKMFDDDTTLREAARVVHAKFLVRRGQVSPYKATEIARMLRKLNHEDPWCRKEAAKELAALGVAAGPTLPQLLEAVRDEDVEVSVAATAAVKRLREVGVLGSFNWHGPEGSRDLDLQGSLFAALDDEEWIVSLHAAEALARLSAAAAPIVLRLSQRVERDQSGLRPAAHRLWESLRKEGALLELGTVLDTVLPVLVDRLAELDGSRAETALRALELLHRSGLLLDEDGYLREVGEVMREGSLDDPFD